jgi:SAM-dependent methyltransferase
MDEYTYVGSELDCFSAATRWKDYLRHSFAPYLGEEVLEVGAGIGGTTKRLCRGREERWLCLEPDAGLADRLAQSVRQGELPACCAVVAATLEHLEDRPQFDTILYIDVLEHIEDDAEELARAARRLKPGGHLIALSPAHQWLYTPFDKAIGHYRRYTKKTLRAITPAGLVLVRLRYLDSVGLLASLGNRLVLKSAMPSAGQIALWDQYMVRMSRLLDPLLGFTLGKSIMGVWRRH